MKKYFSGITAVILAIAFSAFTNIPAHNVSTQWFLYSPVNPGGESNYMNYTATSGTPPCTIGSQLCAVFTSTDAQGHPIVPVNDPGNRKLKN